MGIFTLPIAYLGGLLFALFLIIQFTVGNLAFDQMWTNQALENSTSAGMTQVAGDHSNHPFLPSSAQVLNVVDAENVANTVWNMQNQTWTPTGQPITATFTPSAVNPTTPPGQFDTLTGTAQVTFQEDAINHFIDHFDKQSNANFGGTITDSVSSTLPAPLQ